MHAVEHVRCDLLIGVSRMIVESWNGIVMMQGAWGWLAAIPMLYY